MPTGWFRGTMGSIMQRTRNDQLGLPGVPTESVRDALADGVVIRVCHGPSCDDGGAGAALHHALRAAVLARGLQRTLAVAWQSCFGRCRHGPNVALERWRGGALSPDAQLRAQLGLAHADLALVSHVAPADVEALVERALALLTPAP